MRTYSSQEMLLRCLCGCFNDQTVRTLGVILDDQLSFAANIAATARSHRLILHNIRRIRLFLAQQVVQVLVRVLPLATCGCQNPFQHTGTCAPCCEWLCPI